VYYFLFPMKGGQNPDKMINDLEGDPVKSKEYRYLFSKILKGIPNFKYVKLVGVNTDKDQPIFSPLIWDLNEAIELLF